ncbi:MAG: hypothetical protein Q7S56_00615 [Nanoarchaeota archaeon]|nr:hypothetical protein [Nanoarchaeota archaeon]
MPLEKTSQARRISDYVDFLETKKGKDVVIALDNGKFIDTKVMQFQGYIEEDGKLFPRLTSLDNGHVIEYEIFAPHIMTRYQNLFCITPGNSTATITKP